MIDRDDIEGSLVPACTTRPRVKTACEYAYVPTWEARLQQVDRTSGAPGTARA